MAQSLYMVLKKAAVTSIDVVTPPLFGPLLAMMPQVNQSIESPFRSGRLDLADRYRLGRELSGHEYDQVIVLPNSWKSALPTWFAGIPLRTGYLGEQRWGLINDVRKLDEKALPMTAQRFAALGVGKTDPAPDLDTIRPSLEPQPETSLACAAEMHLEAGPGPILGLCPGAEYGPAKQWPAGNFAETAVAKLDDGWQVWILGSDKDAVQAQEINRRCQDRCIDLTGRTSIAQAVHLMALCTAVVSNDSGLMHVAAALQKPLVAVFGSTDPGHTPPLNHNHRIEYLALSCSPCFKRQCPLQHLDCLTGITPRKVLDDLAELCAS